MPVRKMIASVYGWGIAEQALAEADGRWSEEFNAILTRPALTVVK